MKSQTQFFMNPQGEVIAKGRITPTFIDLVLKDGSRFYRSQSIDFNILKDLDIAKVLTK